MVSPRRVSAASKRYSAQGALRPADLAAAIGRTVSDSTGRLGESAPSSRSTSRSRSPLPSGSYAPLLADSIVERAGDDPHISTLQSITAIATEILDTSVGSLTSHPTRCADFISRVQAIGRAWDEHPEWPCRGYYVQLLLTVAGLSRVVEWCVLAIEPWRPTHVFGRWQAEKVCWQSLPETGLMGFAGLLEL